MCSRGDEDALNELETTQEEAKAMLRKFKENSKAIETFRPSFPEVARSELIGILNNCIPIKKYFSFNLLKLVKRAIQEVDLDLLKVLVEDV